MKKAVVLVITGLLVAALGMLAGCAGKKPSTVAFLLPENVTPRWEAADAPLFKMALAKLIPNVQVDVLNALNDPSKQQSQAEAELTNGAKVLVLAAADQKAASVIVNETNKQKVPVIAHDRLVIINGSPTDDNAHLVNTGIHEVFDPRLKSKDRILVGDQRNGGRHHRRGRHRRGEPLQRTREPLVGAAGFAGDRERFERPGPDGATARDQVHGRRRDPAGRGHARRPGQPQPGRRGAG